MSLFDTFMVPNPSVKNTYGVALCLCFCILTF